MEDEPLFITKLTSGLGLRYRAQAQGLTHSKPPQQWRRRFNFGVGTLARAPIFRTTIITMKKAFIDSLNRFIENNPAA